MSCHMTTGNRLDVVYEYENGRQVIKGLKPWNGELIPLTDPVGLVKSLEQIIKECEEYKTR